MRLKRYIFLLSGLILSLYIRAQCAVVPDFTFQITTNTLICTNVTSTGTVPATTYTWNFFMDPVNSATIPVGASSITLNTTNPPPITYTLNGQYLVELLASNHPTCATQSYTTTIVICTFTSALTQTVAGGGNVVTYSTNAADQGPHDLKWKFQDGMSALVNPYTHIYFNGTFNDSLFLYFANDQCAYTLTTSITVNNNPCLANAAFTYTTLSGGMVNFASVNFNPALDYYWDFGDGSFSTQSNPGHTYVSGGNYTVTLASNMDPVFQNCTDTIKTNVNVTSIPCIANTDFSIVKSSSVQNTYFIIPNNPYNFSFISWDWGDGNLNSGTTFTNHVYNSLGNYQICLSATAACGATAKTCTNVMLSKDNPGSPIYVNVVAPPLATSLEEWRNEPVFDLYPNPVRDGYMYLRTGSGFSPDEVEIYDLFGRSLHQLRPVQDGAVFKVDVASLENGIYVLRIKLPKKEARTRLIISNQ